MTDPTTELMEDIASIGDTPITEEDKSFEAPWQLRSFGAVVALYEADAFPWEEIQQRLINEVENTDDSTMQEDPTEEFYEQWLSAFERLVIEEGIIDMEEFEQRAKEFSAGERDASEFVKGDKHTHDH
jgi:nitrile hydratase accessory protein